VKIPASQFESLLQQDEAAFEQRAMDAVRAAHPIYRETDGMRRDSVRAGFKRARRHGLTADEDLIAYVLIMYRINPNFDQQPQIAAMLADTVLSPAQRWNRLFDHDFDEAWEDAARWEFRDGSFWDDPDRPTPAPESSEPLTEDDWAELVVALAQAQSGPGPYPPATPEQLADARERLAASLAKRRAMTPEDWDARADEVAEQLRARRDGGG
jgi:hypothetical protein